MQRSRNARETSWRPLQSSCGRTALVATRSRWRPRWNRDVALVGLAGSLMLMCFATPASVAAAEAFADRRYEADGTLRSRRFGDALLRDPSKPDSRRCASRNSTVCSGGAESRKCADDLRSRRHSGRTGNCRGDSENAAAGRLRAHRPVTASERGYPQVTFPAQGQQACAAPSLTKLRRSPQEWNELSGGRHRDLLRPIVGV